MMRALALDFDGVICDSGAEVRKTSLDAWTDLFPDSRIAHSLPGNTRHRATLDRLIPLGNRAEDFGVALFVLDNNLPIDDQASYNRVRDSLGSSWLETYHHAFYAARRRRRESEPETWLALHTTYPRFVTALVNHIDEVPYGIVTAKDRDSVMRLFDYFGCANLFPSELIFDKETGVHKTAHLSALACKLDLDVASITFVDDKVNHLHTTSVLGIRPVLADWGHNTPQEHDEARSSGFAVASLDTAEEIIFGA